MSVRSGVYGYAQNAGGNSSSLPVTFNGKLTAASGFVVSFLGKTLFSVDTTGLTTFLGTVAQIIGASTGFAIRNNANNASNLAITDAGAVTVRNGLTVTTGGETVNGLLTANNGATVNGTIFTANAGGTITGSLSVSGLIVANGGIATAGGTAITMAAGVGSSFAHAGTLGFYGAAVQGKQTVTGSKGANAALTSLMSALSTYGLVTDSTT